MRTEELILYRNFDEGDLLADMVSLMEKFDRTGEVDEGMGADLYRCIHRLLEMAGRFGFTGNLWHCYLTDLLVNNENSYSHACEMRGEVEGTVNSAVLHDISIFRELYDYDFEPLKKAAHNAVLDLALHYEGNAQESRVYNQRIKNRICTLARKFSETHTPEEMKRTLTGFYQEYGVGKFGLHKAFRIARGQAGVSIDPILNIAHVKLSDLVGYELQKRKLLDNTEAFVSGRKANNCLLFGDAGTGKSSCIKAIANEFYGRGLRIIEVYKHQFQDLNDVIAQIKNRNYKFILYMDDLSFEEFEIEYKYLKAVIEGGLEKKPDNILIYATSNRRHLIRESFKDKQERDEELHTNDTVQEKLSLVSRFGVTIYFGSPDKRQFQEIVKALADRAGLKMEEEELFLQANRWELSHGGLSGRTAQQFIDYLLGKESGIS
ncbi:MAG: AAA family ATPase [Clostridiales bacterium]|nr:MAG: AAA family ATPase [Clostridiales bacterium]HJA32440.1 ATP-binding protein [Candidatus Eisenbergiella pullicola]